MIKSIIYLLSALALFVVATMIFPLIVSLLYHENQWKIFLGCIIIFSVILAIPVFLIRRKSIEITNRVALAVACIGWFIIPLISAVPFIISGEIGGFLDSYFEAISGFTTTGASILPKPEIVSHGILFWRSFIQWLGGMGIILLGIALFAFFPGSSFHLYKAEVPGPTKDEKFFPKISTLARVLWITYTIITLLEIALLWVGGMNLFDSFCHSFTTMATGGFSTKSASISYWESPFIQIVIIVFMVLAGTNFSLHFTIFKHKGLGYFKDAEFRMYIAIMFVSTIVLRLFPLSQWKIEETGKFLLNNSFQVVSIMTTTGFSNCDFEKWKDISPVSEILLVTLMFIGGMQSSTGGGIKVARILILLKLLLREIKLIIHPKAIHKIKIMEREVTDDTLNRVSSFFFFYMLIFVISSLLISFAGVDIETSLSSVAACLNNIGPGFGAVGAMDNYSSLPVPAKWILIFDMVTGRLELFTVIVAFFPSFWKK